jgi:hypothetical protein
MKSPICFRGAALLVLLGVAVLTPFRTGAESFGADMFAMAPAIGGDYSVELLTEIDNYTKEAGEPNHSVKGMQRSAWWKWTAPSDGYCTLQTLRTESFVDTVIAVYTGSAVNNLVRVASGEDTPGRPTSQVTFFATAGSLYHIAVDANQAILEDTEVLLQLRHVANVARRGMGEWRAPNHNSIRSGNGILSINITASGFATGTLFIGPTRHAFKSQMTVDGYVVVTIPRRTPEGLPTAGATTLVVDAFFIQQSGSTENFSVSDGTGLYATGVASPLGVFSKETPTPYAGTYNIGLEFGPNTGAGFLLARVSPTGSVILTGVAGDGQKLAIGSALTSNGHIAVHQSFYGGNGHFNGRLLASMSPTRLLCPVPNPVYRRPALPGSFHASGLVCNVTGSGRPYVKPTPGNRALDFLTASAGAGKLTIDDAPGEIGTFSENLTLTTGNLFAFTSAARKPKLKLNAANGLVTGSIVEPAGKVRPMRGILHIADGMTKVRGFVGGVTRTAGFRVTP